VYTVEPYPDVQEAITALPEAARAGYEDAVKVMGLIPWNGQPYSVDKPDGLMRQLVFGPYGKGLVTYLILEDQQRVDVLRVQWAG
jgi:hypothetical protein